MISEFEELSQKINQLAEMTQNLRRENARLRQANAILSTENAGYTHRMGEAQRRVEALLENIPALVEAGLAEAQAHFPAEEKEA